MCIQTYTYFLQPTKAVLVPKSKTKGYLGSLSYHKLSREMRVPQTNSYNYLPTSTIMENYTTCPPWPESTGKNQGFRKSVTCKVLPIYWFPDYGIMVPTSLIKQSSSAQLSPESDKPFFPQSNITKEKVCHTPYEKKTL